MAKLTPEQKELLNLEIETLHESWLAQLKDEVLTKEFLNLKRFLKAEKDAGQKVFPPEKEIYSWFVLPFWFFFSLKAFVVPKISHFGLCYAINPLSFSLLFPCLDMGFPSQSISVACRMKKRCKNPKLPSNQRQPR